MKNIHDQKGSVFLDVIAAMFIMTLTGIIVFNSVFFNLKMQSALKDMDRMNSVIEDEIPLSAILFPPLFSRTPFRLIGIKYSLLIISQVFLYLLQFCHFPL